MQPLFNVYLGGRLSKRGSSSSLLSRQQQMGSPIGGMPRVERKMRMSFLVVHDISEQSPYAILKASWETRGLCPLH